MLWPHSVASGDGFEPYLETSLLDNVDRPIGLVAVLPGGGYCNRAPHEATPIAEKFNQLGFHSVVIQYRTSPSRFPEPQRDALRAIKIIRANAEKWRVDPDKIALLGFSAGGHLAASCGTIFEEVSTDCGDSVDAFSGRPDAMVLCYPVISITEDFGHQGSGKNLLGEERFAEPEARRFDLEHRVTAATPPAFIWHTATDGGVSVKNSLAFAEAMWAQHLTASLHVFPEGRHGLGLAPEYPDIRRWPELAADFLVASCAFPIA